MYVIANIVILTRTVIELHSLIRKEAGFFGSRCTCVFNTWVSASAPWVLPITPYKCFSYVVMISTCVLASVCLFLRNKLIDIKSPSSVIAELSLTVVTVVNWYKLSSYKRRHGCEYNNIIFSRPVCYLLFWLSTLDGDTVVHYLSVTSQSMSVTVCAGEWSRRPWTSVDFIHWRQVAWVHVSRQRWSCFGGWQGELLHSPAKQSVTAATSPHQAWLSSAAAMPTPPLLQWTYITTVRCTLQQWVVAWRHLGIQCTMSDWLITTQLRLTYNVRKSVSAMFTFLFWCCH